MADAVLNDRLQMTVREAAGIAYNVGSSLVLRTGGRPSTWSIAVGTRPENLDRARAMTIEALRAVRESEPGAEELQTLVGRIEGRELMRRITSIGQAYGYGMDLFRGGNPGDGVRRVESLARVTPAEAREAARALYDAQSYAMAVVK
jgi:predicted Zn-dependent peptidase